MSEQSASSQDIGAKFDAVVAMVAEGMWNAGSDPNVTLRVQRDRLRVGLLSRKPGASNYLIFPLEEVLSRNEEAWQIAYELVLATWNEDASSDG